MNYPSIRIEGAILSPDILDHLDDAAGQRPADFGLDTGTRSVGSHRPTGEPAWAGARTNTHRIGCWWLSKSHFLRRTRNLQPN
ncbi:protein of unknown function [Acidithiobacillus ferrivorans]|uniref:Uncharacterized protein n=1 Tax=Acidithiobacillus ferrivorans TaxID=160808 RepID=A0ABY1MQV9_9PROT|nr:protein of unknown function [Acidithiobacillus ferrivorans]